MERTLLNRSRMLLVPHRWFDRQTSIELVSSDLYESDMSCMLLWKLKFLQVEVVVDVMQIDVNGEEWGRLTSAGK